MNLSLIGKWVYAVISVVASFIAGLLGGWDGCVATLLCFMVLDFILGVINAWIFHKSSKTGSGGFKSVECWKGLARKFGSLVLVIIAHRLDLLMGASYIRDACVMCFILNEAFSIVETLAVMGVPIPAPIKRALDLLHEQNPDGNYEYEENTEEKGEDEDG